MSEISGPAEESLEGAEIYGSETDSTFLASENISPMGLAAEQNTQAPTEVPMHEGATVTFLETHIAERKAANEAAQSPEQDDQSKAA